MNVVIHKRVGKGQYEFSLAQPMFTIHAPNMDPTQHLLTWWITGHCLLRPHQNVSTLYTYMILYILHTCMKYNITCKPSDTELHCWVTEDDWNSRNEKKLKCTHACISAHEHTSNMQCINTLKYCTLFTAAQSSHTKKPLAPNSMFTALQLLHPLTDKQGSPPLQHYCWSHLLHTPHTEAQLWIWNGTLEGCMFPFSLQHIGSWHLLWLSGLKTTSDFL